MSQTFTLKGRSHQLEAYFVPPIELDPRFDYSLALISLNTWNTIPNIEKGRNRFYYTTNSEQRLLEIPTGSYELEDIEHFIQDHLSFIGNTEEERNRILSLKPNNNTLK